MVLAKEEALSQLASAKQVLTELKGEVDNVGVLGIGVPRLACLRPTAWLYKRARTAHLHQQAFKTLARGGEIKVRGTLRGFYDASHDDWRQEGANA